MGLVDPVVDVVYGFCRTIQYSLQEQVWDELARIVSAFLNDNNRIQLTLLHALNKLRVKNEKWNENLIEIHRL